ncbi:Uncharacterised protein [Mycobacteroides abscessus subsp. massiliense]|nr:Uncharacterised protein [Mycobacteroides abscessus subsp. massiliense]
MTYVGNGPESHRIIPLAIRTQNIESMERQAAELEAVAAEREARLGELRVAIAKLADAMQSPGSESLLMEMRYAAVEAQNVIDAIIGTSNCQYLWIGVFQATSVPVGVAGLSAGSGGVMSTGRSSSLPLWNTAPARTRATRCGAFTARQRACAASMSL